VKTFASVWDAIEDFQSEAASMKARAQLMRVLQRSIARQDRQVQSGCAIRSRGTSRAQSVDRAAQGGVTNVAGGRRATLKYGDGTEARLGVTEVDPLPTLATGGFAASDSRIALTLSCKSKVTAFLNAIDLKQTSCFGRSSRTLDQRAARLYSSFCV
jgi:hypothetical protein